MSADAAGPSRSGEPAPLAILVAALGGQGGGVLTDWIVHAARLGGHAVQATSTPGVSQRTGATTYYIEIAASGAGGAQALGLSPVPGRVDVLLCAELLEAARMLERGMCTPSRTTVIASTHRVYTTREKMSASDGRFDAQRVVGAIAALARRSVLFDMEEARARHRAAISAALFGALAGSGAAPLARTACEAAIRAAGKGVEASLAAFAEAYDRAATGESAAAQARTAVAAPSPDGAPPSELESRIAALPPGVAQFARPGAAQVAAYQDVPYASRYVDRVERIARAEASAAGAATACDVAREVARHLALWMCYDDVIRVATQKLRAARFARIRQETGARAGDVVRVYDYFKPGAAEIAAILPRGLGAWLERRALARASRAPAGRPVTLQTTSVAGLALLRAAAALRPLRPRSLRFAREQQEIGQWLAVVERALAEGAAGCEVALELARLPRLRKGYGDTWTAGHAQFERILAEQQASDRAPGPDDAQRLRVAMQAAVDSAACAPAAPAPVRQGGQPVQWVGRDASVQSRR